MKIRLSCKEAAAQILESQDRTLALRERAALKFHLVICKACPNFKQQIELMRVVSKRWRTYAESEMAKEPSQRP